MIGASARLEVRHLLIPMKAVTDSDLMPGSDSDGMPVDKSSRS